MKKAKKLSQMDDYLKAVHQKNAASTSWSKEYEQLVFRQRKRMSNKKPKITGSKNIDHLHRHQQPKKKFDFSHMKASKYADIRKFITVPKSKESKLTPEELRKELSSEASKLAKPTVRKSTLAANMTLVRKFDNLMDELGEERKPTPHRALMFLGYLKRQRYSVTYISKGLTCLKYHPNLDDEFQDIATHPDVRNALVNLRKNVLHTEDSRIPLTVKAVEEFESIMDRDFSPNTALTMKMGIWLGLTCMLRLELIN